MSELISGKEAKLEWANGKTIEFHYADTIWAELPSCAQLSIFDDEEIKFRLKPRTITINGIEVPAPFEPKEGELFYYISDEYVDGFSSWDNFSYKYMAVWRTEEEIKQVITALRKVFNDS